jgi:excisionase family DNA binding protein
MAKGLFSTSEAARVLGISRIAVFKKIRQGRLPAFMVAGGYAITPAALATEKARMVRREELREIRRKKKRYDLP